MIKLFDGDKELNQDLFPLDNFSLYGITMDGITFKTGEHTFQYLKFIGFNDEIANKVLNADTPLDARNIAIENKKSRNPNWKDIKYDCMLNIFKLKAEQNPIVKETLLKTGNYTIIEMCEDEDTDWGVDKNLQGENNLGKLWMKVRDELVGGTIVLTSCGLRNNELKERFYSVVSKEELKNKKVLYITTAIDGEPNNSKEWVEEEYKSILDLGISESNITEYKIGNDLNIDDFDIIYMMGGNTIYLLDMIRKYNFGELIIKFLNDNKVYIGSSAGSQIMGSTIKLCSVYENNLVNMTDFTALGIVKGEVVPHANKKEELIKNSNRKDLILLYDGDGIIIK